MLLKSNAEQFVFEQFNLSQQSETDTFIFSYVIVCILISSRHLTFEYEYFWKSVITFVGLQSVLNTFKFCIVFDLHLRELRVLTYVLELSLYT